MPLLLPPLAAQLFNVLHVGSDPHCIAALLGLLHFRTAQDTFHEPPPALRTRLLQLVADFAAACTHATQLLVLPPPPEPSPASPLLGDLEPVLLGVGVILDGLSSRNTVA